MRLPRRLPAFLAVSLLSACAGLPSGGRQSLRVLSEPEGVLATSSLGPSCTTPCTLDVSRFEGFQISFSKSGYVSQTITVASILPAGRGDGLTLAPGVRFGLAERNTLSDAGANFRRELLPNPVFARLEPAQ